MSRLAITIDGDDWSAGVLDESVALVSVALGAEIGQGGFNRDDLAPPTTVPALKDVTVEDPRADTPRLFTGMVGPQTLERGSERRADNRTPDVTLWDVNALWDGVILTGSDCKRPAETDYARMAWLATKLAAVGISVGVMPNTNTVNMDAVDYREDPLPRRVASDCAEASQKNYFLYDWDGSGPYIYYDKHTGTSLGSTLSLSSDLSDVDHTTVLELQLGGQVELDPTNIYSAGRFKYASGHVDLEDTDIGLTTSADYRPRVAFVEDSTVKSSARATNKLTKYLTAASTQAKSFRCAVELTAEQAGEIQAGMRIQIKAPHLTSDELDTTDFVWFRITRRELSLAPTEHGVSRERYIAALEFADDVKMTSFHDPRPGDGTDASDEASSAISLTRYRLFEEIGGGPFGPFAGLWYSVDPDFAFNSYSSPTTSEIEKRPDHNVPWPYTDCGLSTGAVAGLAIQEAFYRCQVDLDAGDVAGIRVTVADFSASTDGFAEDTGAIVIGIHTGASSSGAELSASGQFTECGRVSDTGGTVWIPRSLLIDNGSGYCWIVVAPGWNVSSDLLVCNAAGLAPGGYGELGANSGGDAPVLVSAELITISGTGMSPWLPAVGDVDGSNAEFELPMWNGDGTPRIRVGVTELTAGEYSADGSTLTVTLDQAPADELDGQIFYRAQLSEG